MANIIELLIKAQDLASDKLKKVEGASNDLGQALSPLKRGLDIAGVAIVAAGAASIKMAGDLQQSLNVFQSVSGATAQQMSLVSEKARQLGKDASLPGISAADAAQAMTELAKAGLSVNDTLAASKGVLSLAKAGNLDVASASGIAAQALNAFSLKGTDAGKVADVLSAAANASASDVTGMAQGMQQAAGVASQFGVSLQDTVTTLALFSNRGMQGSDAGTSLKTMLIALANPSKQASDMMKQIGLNAYDASGKFVGMGQLAINLQKSLKGLTDQQKQQALSTIFGTDAFRAASFLADSAGQSYDNMSKAVNKAGAATDLAKAQNSGFNGALDNLRSTLETMATDIGTKLLPPLTAFLQKLSNSGIFDAVVKNLNKIIISLGILAGLVAAFKIGMFIQNFVRAAQAMKAATGATSLFNAVLMANPIVLIVMAVIALIAILVVLQVKFNIFGKAWAWIKSAASAALDGIKTGLKAMGDFFSSVFNTMKSVTHTVFKAITDSIKSALNAISNFFSSAFNAMKLVAQTVFKAIEAYVMFWFNVYKAVFDAIVTVAMATWKFLYSNVIKPIIDVIVGYIKISFAIWSYIMQWIIALALYAWNFIYANVIKPVIDQIVAAWNFWAGVFQSVMNWIVNTAIAAWTYIYVNVISPVIKGVVSIVNWLGNAVVSVWNWIVNTAINVWNFLYANVITPVVHGIVGTVNWLGNVVVGIWNWIVSVAAWAWNAVASWASNAWNRVVGIWNGVWGFFSSIAGHISGALGNAFGAIGGAASSGFNAAKGAVVGGINWIIDKINWFIDKANSIADKVPGAPHIGRIGHLASGTPYWQGGVTMVGERGPELVSLPQGSRVMSATQTRQAMDGMGKSPTNNFYGSITINTADAADRFFDRLNQNAELAAMGVPT